MKFARRFFEFYLNSSIHVAFAVVSLVAITVSEFKLELPRATWFFVFFGTITGYNFVKYAKIAKLHHHSLTDMLKTIQIFSFISFACWLYVSSLLSFSTILVAGLFGGLTFFYAVPIPFSKNLRNLAGFKIFIVALVWAGTTVVVPIVSAGEFFGADHWVSFTQRVLLVVVLTLPFEIRDLQFDATNLKTLPQQFGLKNVKIFGLILLFVVMLLQFLKSTTPHSYTSCLVVISIIIGGALVISRQNQSRYFASFFVEGIPMLWFCLLLLIAHFLA